MFVRQSATWRCLSLTIRLDSTVRPTFEELKTLVVASAGKGVWVKMFDDLRICLMGINREDEQVFTAKFLPCATNSREYQIAYKKVMALYDPEDERGK